MKTIILNREAIVRISKHAWNGYSSLPRFGYLLGLPNENHVIASLPFSRNQLWFSNDTKWYGIDKGLKLTKGFAKKWHLKVVGLYSASDDFGLVSPAFIDDVALKIHFHYSRICCYSCSFYRIKVGNEKISCDKWQIPTGKRSHPYFYQKRIYQDWIKTVGKIDYSNQ